MENTEKCCICGKKLGYMEGTRVEGKNHFIKDICWNCYNTKIKNADPILILQAKVEAIAESLSDIQRQQVDSIANSIIVKQIFNELE